MYPPFLFTDPLSVPVDAIHCVPGGRGREATLTRLFSRSILDLGSFAKQLVRELWHVLVGSSRTFSERSRLFGFSSGCIPKKSPASLLCRNAGGVRQRGEPRGPSEELRSRRQLMGIPIPSLRPWFCTPLRGRERRLAPCREVSWCVRGQGGQFRRRRPARPARPSRARAPGVGTGFTTKSAW